MMCWSERWFAHCLLRALVGCAGLGATARADGSPACVLLTVEPCAWVLIRCADVAERTWTRALDAGFLALTRYAEVGSW
ncbi:hypothetical protein T492DRAFT_862947 [Pavlovales sp. CCMP2436]|nr:hypothetical protein T492DRAFT_862947 [Pavlovales sp. CCMP2436]